ncbi:MAG: hypothetical protein V3U58_01650 [Thermodesulfobacteriota bacterium]
MNDIIVVDSYGNRFYELFEHNGQVSGFDYTKRKLVQGEEARNIVKEIEALKNHMEGEINEGLYYDLLSKE